MVERGNVKSIIKAVEVLKTFSRDKPMLTMAELSRITKIPLMKPLRIRACRLLTAIISAGLQQYICCPA